MKQLIKKAPFLVALVVAALMIVIGHYAHQGDISVLDIVLRYVFTVILIIILKFGYGLNCLKPEKKAIRRTFRYAWPCLILAVLPLGHSISSVINGGALNPNLVPELIKALIFCIGVGFYEELLFRGLLGCGVLKSMKNSEHGFLAAVLVSGLVFGVGHIIFSIDTSSVLNLMQCVVKTLQTGLIGVLFMLIFCKTKSLTGAVIFHALFDFLALVSEVLTVPNTEEVMETGQYVTNNMQVAIASMSVLLLSCLLILIAVIITKKKHIKEPDIKAFKAWVLEAE